MSCVVCQCDPLNIDQEIMHYQLKLEQLLNCIA